MDKLPLPSFHSIKTAYISGASAAPITRLGRASRRTAISNSTLQDGVLYYFAMENIENPQSQPLTLLALDLKSVE